MIRVPSRAIVTSMYGWPNRSGRPPSASSLCKARWPECTWVSMNPGATRQPRASITRSATPSNSVPTCTMRSPS
ncbi:Uncharacterised protein [Bordetella pertussis]|nr:Uncharacterised protein [Bordetella pertussis]